MSDTSTSQLNTKQTGTGGEMSAYQMSIETTIEQLKSDAKKGLSSEQIQLARDKHGSNTLTQQDPTGWFGRFFKQFKNPLVLILLFAGLVTLAIGRFVDTVVIFTALGVNVVIGAIQEGRASRAFQALDEQQSTKATVIRNGKKRVIPAEEVVAGDIVELNSGMSAPADIRLIEENNLKMNEAALTGEWEAVEKDPDKISESVSVPDRKNMAWKGTLVAAGEGKGVVTAVGDNTQVGKIAAQLRTGADTQTPIQRHMQQLARFLAVVSLLAVAAIFILGMIRGQPLVEMLVFSIAVAVSVVPEGLPAAVTVVLALGMEKILSRGGLVRNLRAAETLGSTTTILTDKTGTLTQAKMVVDELLPAQATAGDETEDADTQKLLEAAITNTDAFVEISDDDLESHVRGEPIEKAIISRGQEAGISKERLDQERSDYIAFSSKNRFSVSVREGSESGHQLTVSGAPEMVLEQSTSVAAVDGKKELTDTVRKNIQQALQQRTEEGKRVIAVASKQIKQDTIDRKQEGEPEEGAVSELTFLGLISLADPVRDDVAQSIEQAKGAGVHVVMVTGDNPETASYIARQAGIATEDARPITGPELEDMTDEEVIAAIKNRNVFARVLPNQKLRIAKLLQHREEVVAMTGDGVNDAPALRTADIGVAVGSGTEVAREASDLVLLDDSFSIIVAAIEEGRRIIDNLKKIVAHLLSVSFGELFLIGGALVVGLPIPALAAQILWVNIVEGGLLTFVFAAEPPAPDVMDREPTTARMKNLVSQPLRWLIIASGTITGVAAFIIYLILSAQGLPLGEIRTLMFVILTIDALFFTIALKNFYQPVYNIDFTNNKYLFISLGLSLVALFGALFVPALRSLLSLVTLSANQWLLLLGVGIFDLLVVEVAKYWLFQRSAE